MTYTEHINLTHRFVAATISRKRLMEIAYYFKQHPSIKGEDPYLTITYIAGLFTDAVQKLDFALDQLESFMTGQTSCNSTNLTPKEHTQ